MDITEIGPSRNRKLSGTSRCVLIFLTCLGIFSAIYNLFHFVIAEFVFFQTQLAALLLAAFLPPVFLYYPATQKSPRTNIPWYDWLLAVFSLLGPLYVVIYTEEIFNQGWAVRGPISAQIFGLITWGLVLEGVRRTGGKILAGITFVASIYPLFAHRLPGMFFGTNYPLDRLISFHYLGGDSMFGIVIQCLPRIFVGFILFGIVLFRTGGGQFFLGLAMGFLGHKRGGPAKTAILASSLFGTLSGSSVANTVATGTITIPAMKKMGYEAPYACAVEACASTGGIITPPVMGLAAFLMADFLGVSYATVCYAAAIPAVLYYLSLFLQCDFHAAKKGLKGMPREELPNVLFMLKKGWYYLFALFCLIIFIVWFKWEARAPYYASLVLLACSYSRKETRVDFNKFIEIIEETGKSLVGLTAILAGVGLLIGSLVLTGFAHGFTSEITQLAKGNLFILLSLTAVAAYIMGMGITISAIYIFLAMLVGPALIKMGIHPLAAHLFLIYWAKVSEISPPVALTALVAAGIGNASYMKTGIQSVILGFVSLFVPFMFVFDPALVGQGTLFEVAKSFFIVGCGVLLLSSSFEGYFFELGRLGWITRIFFALCGILLLQPFTHWKYIGMGVSILGLGIMLAKKRLG
jgi:TRAP transporter 4TM/12TM fusion protein